MARNYDKAPSSLLDLLEEKPKSLSEYSAILRRRKRLFLLPAIGVAIISILVALSLPSVYRSQATILIEDQEMPKDIVGATMESYATRQIELTSRRLLTASSIQSIIEKLEVYGPVDPADQGHPGDLVNQFREDMELSLVSSEELESQRRAGDPIIAFELAFNSGDPVVAQTVTQELVSLFKSENQRSTTSRTTSVSELLNASIAEANEELLRREAELAKFKEENEGALPELYELNLNVLNRAEQQLSDVNLRIQNLRQRQIQLSADLAQLSPSAPVTLPTGETIMSDRERLRALLIDYRRKSSIYEQGHPDLVRLEREIAALKRNVGDAGTYDLLQEQLRQERERLSSLRERYSDDHPDIQNSRAAIAELQGQLATTNPRDFRSDEVADNPAYVFTQTQLRTNELELKSLLEKRFELESKIIETEALIRRAPQVEMRYEAITRAYEDAKAKYLDLQAKLRAAEIAGDVELSITGRRFTVIEPPVLPIAPSSPNRPVIILFGLILAAALGAGCVTLAETLDKSIHGAKQLADILGSPPLAVIPYLDNSTDIARARVSKILWGAAFLVTGAMCVMYVRYVIPLL